MGFLKALHICTWPYNPKITEASKPGRTEGRTTHRQVISKRRKLQHHIFNNGSRFISRKTVDPRHTTQLYLDKG